MKAFLIAILAMLTASAAFADKYSGFTTYHSTAAPTVAEVSTVQAIADVASALGGKYFDISSAGDVILYRVWIDVANASTAPAAGGRTLVEVDIAANDTADTVAAAIQADLDALPAFVATVLTDTVTVTNAGKGATTNVAAGTSGFTVGVTTAGVSSSAAIAPASLAAKIKGWKICNDAVNTSTHLFVGKATDTETDGVMLPKDECFTCIECKSGMLQEMKVSAQAASNGYSVIMYSK